MSERAWYTERWFVAAGVVAATPARNMLLRQNAEPSDPFFRAQITGFRVTVVSRNLVVVDLALRTSDNSGRMAAVTLPERWEQRSGGGDWRTMITDVEQP